VVAGTILALLLFASGLESFKFSAAAIIAFRVIALLVFLGLLFIALHGRPQRLRVNGTATVSREDPLLARTVGAQLMVRVTARVIFPNCPRYIPDMQLVDPSVYAPRPGVQPPEPAWKDFDSFRDCIHPRQPTFKG